MSCLWRTSSWVALMLLLAGYTPASAIEPMVAAGGAHTVGLKSDGTVIAVGYNYYGQLDVASWGFWRKRRTDIGVI